MSAMAPAVPGTARLLVRGLASHGWQDGRVVPQAELTVPVGTHALHQATAVFEGIRAYRIADQVGLFRLDDHLRRLASSAALMRIALPCDLAEIRAGVLDVVRTCGVGDAYVRPVVYLASPSLSTCATQLASSAAIVVWDVAEGSGAPAECEFSRWRRPHPMTYPIAAKCAASYAGATLAKTEAVAAGADEAIQLDAAGLVAEATTSNLFAAVGGTLLTPSLDQGILNGITRRTVVRLCTDLGIPVAEARMSPADLAGASELFLTGTAAEITPVSRLGSTRYQTTGPITTALTSAYRRAVRDADPERGWVTVVQADV
jgi:branched-chain amino acid aminotransferase